MGKKERGICIVIVIIIASFLPGLFGGFVWLGCLDVVVVFSFFCTKRWAASEIWYRLRHPRHGVMVDGRG